MKETIILFWALVIASVAPSASADSVASLTFGIPPQQSPTELTKRWTPVLQYLSEKSGLTLKLKTAKDIPTFQQALIEGRYDIAFINPNTYVAANKVSGYQAFAKEKSGKSFGLIVVRKGGAINTLTQLSDQTLAFASNTAFMATILPLKHLEELKVPVKIQYVVSIDSVYRSVAKGLFVAGGGETRTLGALDPEIRDQLTLLWQSEELPPFPFLAHPRVKADFLEKLQEAMMDIGQNPQGQLLLKAVNIKALEKASDADYDGVRKLNLPLEVK